VNHLNPQGEILVTKLPKPRITVLERQSSTIMTIVDRVFYSGSKKQKTSPSTAIFISITLISVEDFVRNMSHFIVELGTPALRKIFFGKPDELFNFSSICYRIYL